MAKIRFRKSINLGGGARLNLSRRGVGASVGVPGARVGIGADGRTRLTGSLPGTGLSVTHQLGGAHSQAPNAAPVSGPATRPSYWLGFFSNLVLPGLGMLVIRAWVPGLVWMVALLVAIAIGKPIAILALMIAVLFHYRALYARMYPA